ncbi:probable ubiquitin-like-specific protease 2A [Malania oleifera]|uniref:probable ubiquitin-like-specific protease 2A n=1 Tax=Malania oleifera TaxID=397392 RepID=UPI0025ADEF3D|nr:probable ubiquitin-like-specific protease 2A [Malania oleifera]XP_057970426.1 probable ubiquitin-like-specific protease 2A [Malania oleifera]XP_057970427.1 probable ubiquitin-like-specific protease 2A [Malania oleifera]XP_057970428.1 probable ubiquitin-like-specific protease 2A [Malania oleifera]
MGKRKLRNQQPTCIDLVSPTSEFCGDQISKHRSCWLHMAAYMHARQKGVTKEESEEIRRFELTSPCFLHTFPQRERSRRRIHCRNTISKQNKKLNTNTFDDYLEKMWRSFSEDKRTSFTCLDSLWFHLYLKKAASRPKVLSWIKKKQIFSKKYVFVPIVCWSHWSLLILCHFGESMLSKTKTPCMLLLDSLEMANPRRLEPIIRKFVLDVYKAEGRPENKGQISQIPFLVPQVPQQRDNKECGSFVLYYIYLFVEGAPEKFSISNGYPYFMKQNWFSLEGLEHFCNELSSSEK